MTDKKLISVIVPAYNEEACVEELARRLSQVFDENPSYDFEAIIVENGSIDRTWELLQEIQKVDSVTISALVRSPTTRIGTPLYAGWRSKFPPNS